MRAEITKANHGFTATFERHIKGQPEQVWTMLTETEELQKWFPELRVDQLQKGGAILFDLGDSSFEKLRILELEESKVIGFEWDEGTVRFEITSSENGCALRMVETFSKINPQTAKDLAGWHVCLDVIKALVEGRQVDRKQEWEKEYTEYKRLLQSMSVNLE